FKVWCVNTEEEFLSSLWQFEFDVLVLHYSLFGVTPYMLGEDLLQYLSASQSTYKVAFFQDELWHCQQRFEFLNQHQIDCVYTMIEPQYFKDSYGKFTAVPKVVNYIPGYVSEDLIN